MKLIAKTLVLLCAAAPLVLFGAANPAGQTNNSSAKPLLNPDDLFTNEVIAKGKGVSVTRADLDQEMVGIKANAAAQGQQIPPQAMQTIQSRVLQQIIGVQLLDNEATAADKATAKTNVDDNLKKIQDRAGSEEALNRQLTLLGVSRQDFIDKLTKQAIAETVLKRELNVNITDDQAKKYYDDNPAKFERPEEVHVAHILLSTRDQSTGKELSDDQKAAKKKQMEDILKRARAGEDFGKLVKEYSEDPGSKGKGGEYTFARGQMVPEFEAAAFSLETNQISDIVTTDYGYHIIKLLNKIPAKKLEFSEVKDDLKDALANQEIQKQVPGFLQKLEKKADVQILDPSLKPVETADESPEDAAPAATVEPPQTGTNK